MRFGLWVRRALGIAAAISLGACAITSEAPLGAADPAAAGPAIAHLPLVVVPSERAGDTFAVFYSGDNGWAEQAQGVAGRLAADGVPVVGVSAVRYFFLRKTPERAAADLAAIIDRYSGVWSRPRVILVGYSFGADALPLIAERLPPSTLSRVRLIALVSPSGHGDLAFRVVSWFDVPWPGSKPLEPALRSLAPIPMICTRGAPERRSSCDRFPPELIRSVELSGGHHYIGHLDAVADTIAEAAGLKP